MKLLVNRWKKSMSRNYPNLRHKHPSKYFQHRIRSAAELNRMLPLSPLEQKKIKAELNNPGQNKNRCIYIHIPFCTKSCSFCGYYKCVNLDKNTVRQFVDALRKQIIQLAEKEWVKSSGFNAVYFGGGTPTALPASLFFGLLDTVYNHLPVNGDAEITLESTITDLDGSYLDRLSDSRINRVSIGIQTFQEDVRKKYNRTASGDELVQKINEIKSAGITNICADLMYNLNGQTEESWKRDLQLIKNLQFDGCSVYPLLPFPNAPLVKSGKYTEPDPEKEYRFFQLADDYLASMTDWQAITAVQYGHKENGNANYVEMQAEGADVLALGPGAGGKINKLQYFNSFTVADFLNDNSLPSEKTRIFSWREDTESLASQLNFFRKTALSKNEFNLAFPDEKDFIEFLSENSLIEGSANKNKLTQTGKYWAGNLAELIIKA